MADAARWVDEQRQKGQTGQNDSPGKSAIYLSIRNSIGNDLTEQYSILGIGKPIVDIADDDSIVRRAGQFNGVAPVVDDHKERFVVMQSPVGDNGMGIGVIQGATWVMVDIIAKGDKTCGILEDDINKLASGKPGAKILWAEKGTEDPGTGEQWCYVNVSAIGSSSLVWAMVVGDVPKFLAIDGAAITATPGTSLTQVVNLLQWDAGNLIADDAATTLFGINASGTDIRASVAEPVLVLGFEETVGDTDMFTIVNVMDFRGLPGYVIGVTATDTDTQIPYHVGGEGDFQLDSEACP